MVRVKSIQIEEAGHEEQPDVVVSAPIVQEKKTYQVSACKMITKAGVPCRHLSLPDDTVCFVHKKMNDKEKAPIPLLPKPKPKPKAKKAPPPQS